MIKILSTLFLAAFVLLLSPDSAMAGLFHKCESVGDYKPPRGAFRMCIWPIKTEWEHRHHCLPGGRKIPYKVKVVTYRERYSDGTQRTWKCVVDGTEISLGK